MNDGVYARAVRETFRERPLRTVFIVDDQFPSYEDFSKGDAELQRFGERERAHKLYRAFRERQIPCDIENRIDKLSESQSIDYIRKSDLIILDYNLAANDTRQSVALIRRLAETKHFNTVVLYTLEDDLDGVWINLAVSLRGKWIEPNTLDGIDASLWEQLVDAGAPRPSKEFIKACVVDAKPSWPSSERETLLAQIKGQGITVEKANEEAWLQAVVHQEVRDFLKDDTASREAEYCVVRGAFGSKSRWIQSGNCFVAILGKPLASQEDDAQGKDDAEAVRIFECLDTAFLDWNPSLVQILVSEIQNILELETFANDEKRIRDPQLQVGLLYFMLENLEGDVTHSDYDRLMPPLQVILDKLIETIRHRVTTDGALGDVAKKLFSEELQLVKWPTTETERVKKTKYLFDSAKKMARVSAKLENDEVLFKLNSFLSTEPFRGGSVTTGTIFKDQNTDDYWLCTSPACDLVVRKPNDKQVWVHALDPMRPMIAIRLKPADLQKSLKVATHGKHVFVNTLTGQKAFMAIDTVNAAPSYEFLFLHDSGKTTLPSEEFGLPSFMASHITPGDGTDTPADARVLLNRKFDVVGQLRPEYSSRLLQAIGQHLSRLGVDFLDRVNE